MHGIIQQLVKRYHTNCPFELAERLGIRISFESLGTETRGIYYPVLRRRFIVIDNSISAEWQRFVCAHELGHDRLHRGLAYYFIEKNSLFNVGKLEREANEFATKLLLYDAELHNGCTKENLLKEHRIPYEMIEHVGNYLENEGDCLRG